jgi:GT2 family glycosyltransferase
MPHNPGPMRASAATFPPPTLVSVSVVSHGQGALVRPLLEDLGRCRPGSIEVILTLNVPEPLPVDPARTPYPLRVIENPAPHGFGANHNAAFRIAAGTFFCVLNPDIRLPADPFPILIEALQDPAVGVAAPAIRHPSGHLEDSARRVPTPLAIVRKAFAPRRRPFDGIGLDERNPEWLAGMFLVFRRETFAAVGGFDERYFLYYEDVDICVRLALAGQRVARCAIVEAIHDARRASRRSLRHLRWHVASVTRFFASRPFRVFMWRKLTGRRPDGTRYA